MVNSRIMRKIMRKNSKVKLMIVVLGVIFALSSISSFNINDDPEVADCKLEIRGEVNLETLKTSDWWNNFTFIHIDGNWSTAAGYEWCSGDGSWNNPYVIENITIDASSSPTGSGIFINNSKNDYFNIRNCTVYNAPNIADQAGIKLENTNNGTLIENICSNNELHGILLLGESSRRCINNTIVGNTANNNYNGIVLKDYCDENNITGNTANNNGYSGMILDSSLYNNMTDNTAHDNYVGIYLRNSDYNLINISKCFRNSGAGIMLFQSNENNITQNTMNYNNIGLDITYSDNNRIIKNTLIGNTRAIYEENCNGNIFEGNVIGGSSGGGGDDDDDDDKQETIPGYDIFLIVGVISIALIILLKKNR